MTTLVIGDIHGCADELDALLDASALTPDDTIIALGDLLDKGLHPRRVLARWQQMPNFHSIRGNHEQYHLDAVDEINLPSCTQLRTRWLLDEQYADAIALMRELPLYRETDDALLVHGYYEPGIAPDQQRDDVLLGLDSGAAYLMETYDRPWFDLYDGDKPIITGHKDYTQMQKALVIDKRVYSIDTRCVFGGALTGLLLPEWRWVQIPAAHDYDTAIQSQHGMN